MDESTKKLQEKAVPITGGLIDSFVSFLDTNKLLDDRGIISSIPIGSIVAFCICWVQ